MKYLKTNEGLFSKDEIPKKLIDDIKSEIETKYSVEIVLDNSTSKNVFGKVTFRANTPIGIVDTHITLRRPSVRTETGFVDASRFSRKYLSFRTYFGEQQYSDSDHRLSDWENIDINSVLHNIDYVVRRITDENTAKKETEDFYSRISVDEIKDLAADLYDILGDYEITKTSVKGKKGFQLLFTTKLDFVHNDPNYLPKETFFVPRDTNLRVLTELNSLGKRLFNGYNLFLIYAFVGRNIKVVIYERKKK